jgi:large exoprotein involved in heme utilization and adhesion
MIDFSTVASVTRGDIDGAETGIDIGVAGDVVITNQTGVGTATRGAGRAGAVRLTAGSVEVSGGATLSTQTFPESTGRGGDIHLEVGQLTFTGDGRIVSLTQGAQQAGTVTVTAHDTIHIAGSLSGIITRTESKGTAGSLAIAAPTLVLEDKGTIVANITGTGRAGDIGVEVGQLTLSGGAAIDSNAEGRGPGGTVTVTAHDTIRITGGPSRISSSTTKEGAAGSLAIAAPTLVLEDKGTIVASTIGPGPAGDISVKVGRLTLTGGAQIVSGTFGPGHGGMVMVTATEALTIAGNPSGQGNPSGLFSFSRGLGEGGRLFVSVPTVRLDGGLISTQSSGAGRAGDIELQAGTLLLTGGAQLASLNTDAGQAGNLQVTATDTLTITGRDPATARPSIIVSANLGGSGTPSTVALAAPTLRMAEGALIGGSPVPLDLEVKLVDKVPGRPDLGKNTIVAVLIRGAPSPGRAADLSITASTLTLTGEAAIVSSTPNAQPGGGITIVADRVQLTSGARIESTSGIADEAGTVVSGPGPGGQIRLTATDTVAITGQNSGLSTSTAGAGQGGEITVHAPRLALTDGATISAESTGLGNAGNVTLTLGDTFMSTHGSLVTRAMQADGGNIQITAPRLVHLRDSTITAEVGGGATTVGGNVTIDPQFVLLQHSQIVANAFAGQGGNIHIQAQQVFLGDPASQVSASSALGINGQVAIQAPVTSLSGAVAPLPYAFAQTAEILRSRCAERLREGTVSRFVVGSRDGVPLEPGGLLLSPLEQVSQEGGVHGWERESKSPEAQPEWIWYTQAPAPEGLEVECARWMDKPRTPGTPKYHR